MYRGHWGAPLGGRMGLEAGMTHGPGSTGRAGTCSMDGRGDGRGELEKGAGCH